MDVIDAFETKRKREPQVRFEVEEWKIGGSYYVRATLPDGTVDRIEGFASEGEAGRWIKNESVVWLSSNHASFFSLSLANHLPTLGTNRTNRLDRGAE